MLVIFVINFYQKEKALACSVGWDCFELYIGDVGMVGHPVVSASCYATAILHNRQCCLWLIELLIILGILISRPHWQIQFRIESAECILLILAIHLPFRFNACYDFQCSHAWNLTFRVESIRLKKKAKHLCFGISLIKYLRQLRSIFGGNHLYSILYVDQLWCKFAISARQSSNVFLKNGPICLKTT